LLLEDFDAKDNEEYERKYAASAKRDINM